MIKRMIIMLVVLAVIFGGIFGFKAYKGHMMAKFMASRSAPLQTVSTIKAVYKQWQPKLEAIGSLTAIRGIDVSSEVNGIVSAIHFKQGQDVKKGTLLAELDSDSEAARLQSLKAIAKLANITYRRDMAQFQIKAVSRQTLDMAASKVAQAQANVDEQKGVIDDYFIRAPFSGRLGIRVANLGEYLKAGTAIVTLQSLDPIYLDFHLPQQALAEIRVGQKATAKTDTWPGQVFAGRIEVIQPQVDASTRTVKVRAKLDNPEHKLLPGMYATVDVIVGKPKRYITLPQTAITYNPYGSIAYVVEKKGQSQQGKPQLIAKAVFVTTGSTRGDQVAVLTGVKAGDTVVRSGQIKLRNGSHIVINNSIQPDNNPNPKPKDE